MGPLLHLTSPAGGISVGTTPAATLTWGAGGSTSLQLSGRRIRQLMLRFTVATQALNTLKIYGKIHEGSSVWTPIALIAADYAGASPFITFCGTYNSSGVFQDTDPTTLGASETAVIGISSIFSAIKVTATVGASTGTVTSEALGFANEVALAVPGDLASRTVEVVAIDAAADAACTIKAAAGAGVTITLHALIGRAGTAAGTITIQSKPAGAASDLTGTIPMLIGSANPVPMEKDPDLCLTSEANEALQFTTVSCTFDGYAVISYEA